jgi:hypothetical protein
MPEKTAEDRAERAARDIARTPCYPPDPGLIARVREAVSDARAEGRRQVLREVADAYVLTILNDDDLDGFVDILTDLMDADGVAACPVTDNPQRST